MKNKLFNDLVTHRESIKNRILYGLLFSMIAIIFVTIKTVYFEISPNGTNAYWEQCVQYDEHCITRGFVTSPIGDRLKKQISRSLEWFWPGFAFAPLFKREE